MATPDMLLSAFSDYQGDSFSQLGALILDDAPTLFSEDYREFTLGIVNNIKGHAALDGKETTTIRSGVFT